MRVCVIRRSTLGMLLLAAAGLLTTPAALAQSQKQEIDLLKKQLEELRQRDEKTKQQLEELQRRLEGLQSQPPVQEKAPADKLEEAIQELPKAPTQPTTFAPALVSQRLGGVTFRLIDLSLDVLAGAGGSTVGDEELQRLEGGDHDPRKNGFTLQNVELSLAGAVDPYFTGETHLIFFVDPANGDTTVEMEEAFLTTTGLPFGLQVKAGFFFTEFGLINPNHPHAWHWQDQPIINTRLFGPDGMRQAGLRVGWFLPVPWSSELLLGAQNANGEIMASFLANEDFFGERPIGGRPFVARSVKGP
jgi:cell division protein FtsB